LDTSLWRDRTLSEELANGVWRYFHPLHSINARIVQVLVIISIFTLDFFIEALAGQCEFVAGGGLVDIGRPAFRTIFFVVRADECTQPLTPADGRNICDQVP